MQKHVGSAQAVSRQELLPFLHQTETIAVEVDAAIALVERNRRKQIESLISVLDASDVLAAQVGMPLPGHSCGGGVMCTPYLWTLEKQIAFHQGQIAFGEELLRSQNESGPYDASGDVTTLRSAPSMHADISQPFDRSGFVALNRHHDRSNIGKRRSGDVSPPLRASAEAPPIIPSMFQAPYPFESVSLFHQHNHQMEAKVGTMAASNALRLPSAVAERRGESESLLDSQHRASSSMDHDHIGGKKFAPLHSHLAENEPSTVLSSNKYLKCSTGTITANNVQAASRHRATADISYRSLLGRSKAVGGECPSDSLSERSHSYARENLVQRADSKISVAPVSRDASRQRTSHRTGNPSWAYSGEFVAQHIIDDAQPVDSQSACPIEHHRCCGLDVDLWKVRCVMHKAEASLAELGLEYQVALEDCLRVTAVKREEEHARHLLDAMFYASMPTQRVCRDVCRRVQSLEQRLAFDNAQLSHLQADVANHQAQKDQLVREAGEQQRKIISDFRELMQNERHKMRELLDCVCTTTSVIILDLQETMRNYVEALQVSEFHRCWSEFALHFLGNCYRRFISTTTSGQPSRLGVGNVSTSLQQGEHFVGIHQHLLHLEWVDDMTADSIVACGTTHRHSGSQTNDDQNGRWLEHTEEQKIRTAWYRKHEVFNTLTTAFVLQLEESERQRIEEEEDDTFTKEQTSWNATAQHYVNLKETAHKDALIAAIQLDLAALKSSTAMVSRSASAAPMDNGGGSPNLSTPFVLGGSSLFRARQQRPGSIPLNSSMVPSIYEFTGGGVEATPDSVLQRHVSSRGLYGPDASPRQSITLPSARSFYSAVRSISPGNVSDGASTVVSRSASVRGANSFAGQQTFGGLVESLGISRSADEDPRQASFIGHSTALGARSASHVRTLAPVSLPSMDFPSVPIVVSMALTLEDLGREDVMRKEAIQWHTIEAAARERNVFV